MCDLKTLNRKPCYGINGKLLKPVKLTKWELPVPSARSYWEGVIEGVEKKCTKLPLTNVRQIRRILPTQTFNMVAPILDMPVYFNDRAFYKKVSVQKKSSKVSVADPESDNELLTTKTSTFVHPRTEVTTSDDHGHGFEPNPYALFLKKPRRKAVIWRPLREEDMRGYDPESTLELRAARLLDKVCKEFCEWLKNLGGTVLNEETLKDMFEINFSSEACKTIQVIKREMPTVPTTVANVRHCPQASKLKMTTKEISKDLEVEKRERRVHAFGRALPHDLRFVPPLHKLSDVWVRTDLIPKDLESMNIVWDGIMHLDSVKSFVDYLKDNPTAENAKLLTKLLEQQKIQENPQDSVESVLQKPKKLKAAKQKK